MNRYRMRFAPQIWKPALSPSLVRWLRPLRERQQRRIVNIETIDVHGAQYVREALDAGDGLLIMPNHSSHADPYVIYAAADQVSTPLYIMATWHVFHDRTFIGQWMLRKHGCFSVDREANDIGAFRLATELLQKKPEPLVIFPEGEIYHCNQRVTPFRDGASAIAVAAARKAKRTIRCVPCAIFYRYEEDPTEALKETMGELEEVILWRRRPEVPLDKRIYDFAEVLLVVKELEYFGEARTGKLPERIESLRDYILSQVEERHGLTDRSKGVPERVKAARRTIIEKRSAEGTSGDDKRILDEDLEDLFLVVQSFSYTGDYVMDHPSVERMAETIDKFEEDVLRKATASIRAKRKVEVRFAPPIEVSGDRKARNQIPALSSQVETQVQQMLDVSEASLSP